MGFNRFSCTKKEDNWRQSLLDPSGSFRPFWLVCLKRCCFHAFEFVMQFEDADFFMQEMRLSKPAMPCSHAIFTQCSCRAFCSCKDIKTAGQEYFFLFRSLTDPIPESATESLPVFVWLLDSAPSPGGKLILDVIWVVLEPFWTGPTPFWMVSLKGGVTLMLGIELPSWLALIGVDGLDFEDSRASIEADFWTRSAPIIGLCGEPEGETWWSGPENLVIRSLMLPARCTVLRVRPTGLL